MRRTAIETNAYSEACPSLHHEALYRKRKLAAYNQRCRDPIRIQENKFRRCAAVRSKELMLKRKEDEKEQMIAWPMVLYNG